MASAQDDPEVSDIDAAQASIEELLNIPVITASRRPSAISRSPAAVYVLTENDIRRSGATSLPEALRLVPGVQVARVDANKWAVSIRGFNARAANKLLVLVDGRTIYDPLFTGVLWETKDVLLEDVARIEVVRGPGGALWGANAVNGIINVITKSAGRTVGGVGEAAAGTDEQLASLRYGFDLGEAQALRVYGKWVDRKEGYVDGDPDPDDEASLTQLGFRYDARLSARDSLKIQGDVFDGEQGTPDILASPEARTSGFNLVARWGRELRGGGRTLLQLFYEGTDYEFPVLTEKRDTFDVDLQYQLPATGKHELTWGTNFRTTEDDTTGNVLILEPASRDDTLLSLFFQDEIDLIADKVALTLGAKLESNDYTGSSLQPSARLAWQIDERRFFWAAISRAVRTPSRLEHDFVIPIGGGVEFRGNRTMQDEELDAFEMGYRVQPLEAVSLDFAVFANRYDDLLTTEGLSLLNMASGDVRGLEVAANYVPTERLRIVAGYSFLDMDLGLDPGSSDDPARLESIERSSPEHQAFLRVSLSPGGRYGFDADLRYVDALPAQSVGSYTVANIRFFYSISESLQLSVVARNLLDDHHAEQRGANTSEVEDSIRLALRYSF